MKRLFVLVSIFSLIFASDVQKPTTVVRDGLQHGLPKNIQGASREDVKQDVFSILVYAYPLGYKGNGVSGPFLKHEQGDYEDSFRGFSILFDDASQPNNVRAIAAYMLGLMKLTGQGTKRGYDDAKTFFEKAVELGSKNVKDLASYFLAVMSAWKEKFVILERPYAKPITKLDEEIAVASDKEQKAVLLYQKGLLLVPYFEYADVFDAFQESLDLFKTLSPDMQAKHAGLIGFMNVTIGEAYYQGWGFEKDWDKAVVYYEEAAKDQNNVYIYLGAVLRLLELSYIHHIKTNVSWNITKILNALSGQIYNPVVQRLANQLLKTVLGENVAGVLSFVMT